jgi:hypothetical protein
VFLLSEYHPSQFRYEWMPALLQPFEGLFLGTGLLDGYVRRKANQGVAPE